MRAAPLVLAALLAVSACGGPAQADPGLLDVLVGKEVIGGSEYAVPAERAWFATPHMTARQDSLRVERVLTPFVAGLVGLPGDEELAAGEGREFVLAAVSRGIASSFGDEPAAELGAISVRAGDKTESVEGWNPDHRKGPSSFAVVANVAVGAPVWLEVQDADRTIRWNLRDPGYGDDADSQSAVPMSGAVATPDGWENSASGTFPVTGAVPEVNRGDGSPTLTTSLTVGKVRKTVRVEEPTGWAPGGEAWLVFSGLRLTSVLDGITGGRNTRELSTENLELVADGRELPLVGLRPDGDNVEATFRVPDDLTGATLRHTVGVDVLVQPVSGGSFLLRAPDNAVVEVPVPLVPLRR